MEEKRSTRFSRLAETVVVGLLAGSCGAYLTYAALFSSNAAARALTAANSQALRGVVADYIDRHPEAITAALDAQQAKKAAQQQTESSALIRAHQAEIFADRMSPTMGAAEGDVAIAEFVDFRCPYCKSTAPLLERLLRRDHHVKIVLKNLPILGPQSVYVARLGYAAARIGRFADFYRTIFAKVPPDGDRASIDNAVESMGLNPVALYKQSQTKDIDASLQRDFRLATTLGITGTPALVVGQKLLIGAPISADLADAVDVAKHDTGTSAHDPR
jgi:protein-disulfide isomerase